MAEPVYTVVKTITIGDFNVGKTSLMTREVLNTYTDNFAATIGIDFRLKNYQVGEMSVKGQLWDSWAGGGERFFPMNTHLYRVVHAVAICFSIDNKDSFVNLSKWVQEVRSNMTITKVFLVGCKGDLEPAVSDEEALKFAEAQGLRYFKTSSKQNWGVNELFQVMIKEGLEVKLAETTAPTNPVPKKQKCEIM